MVKGRKCSIKRRQDRRNGNWKRREKGQRLWEFLSLTHSDGGEKEFIEGVKQNPQVYSVFWIRVF